LALANEEPKPARIGACSVFVREAASVFQVNDNKGRLFEMFKTGDGSVIVPDSALYSQPPRLPILKKQVPDFRGAIGAVSPTDVLVVALDDLNVPGPDRVIDVRHVREGTKAIWSFGEVLRIAAAVVELDVSPQELQIGIQPHSVGLSISRRLFIADSHENGAGYAARIGHPDVFAHLLDEVLSLLGPKWEANAHMDVCDSSCPDCLRSYDNRLLHSALDWRLALDMVELAKGQEISLRRWISRAHREARSLVVSLRREGDLESTDVAGLPAVYSRSTRRAAIFGHPLWRNESPWWVEQQVEADIAVREIEGISAVRAFDFLALTRGSLEVFKWLLSGTT
jgi:DEAD/DEAH box helicase domain-containing protein